MGGLDFPVAFFIPATLGACAVFVSVLGSFLCKFVSIQEVTSNRDVFVGIWLRTKLYYVVEEEAGTWDVLKGCGSYDENVVLDATWKAAQAFSIIASVVGAVVTTFVIFAACLSISQRTWKMMGFLLILTSLFQGLTLLFLNSNACGSNRSLYMDLAKLEFADGCNLASGAKMCIAATVLWFVSGVLVCVIPCPNQPDQDFEAPASAKRVPVVDDAPDETPAAPADDTPPAADKDEETPE